MRMLLLQAILLVFLHATQAYISLPLSKVCTRDEDFSSQTDLNQRVLSLEPSGSHSAAKLTAKLSDPPCTMVIEVPKETHVIAVSLYDLPAGIMCPLNLFVEGEEEPWRLDLCDQERRPLFAIYPVVFPHRVTLRWFHSGQMGSNASRINKMAEHSVEIVATAVGRDSICDGEEWVLCWKRRTEKLCVSEEFACDNFLNCPKPGNDEAPGMCPNSDDVLKSTSSRAWDLMTSHIQQIMTMRDKEVNWSEIRSGGGTRKSHGGATEETPRAGGPEGGSDDGLKAFSRLGTWTFVLLMMLACGVLLLLCGLWECCCRIRPPPISMSPRGSTVVASGGTTTTTVVIISSTSPPPQYEDLEQPPDYTDLFPGKSRSTAV